jgi:hypothetical protein
MTEEILHEVGLGAEERLLWHKPEVQLLTISLDTRLKSDFAEDYSREDAAA